MPFEQCSDYCMLDCEVLFKCIHMFRTQLLEADDESYMHDRKPWPEVPICPERATLSSTASSACTASSGSASSKKFEGWTVQSAKPDILIFRTVFSSVFATFTF